MSIRRRRRGQMAILLSMSLVVTVGMMGLVVDVGWAYWRREAATTAAESAVLAAATYAKTNFTTFACGTSLTCESDTACSASPTSPATSTVGAGCLYAMQNGFTNSGKQTVTMAANTTSSPVTGVSPAYWVSATVSETIPQTFSAILGQTSAKVAAKAVAGVFSGGASGCFYLMGSTGIDLDMSGGSISSNCGVYINSTSSTAIDQSGGTVTVSGGGPVQNRGGYTHSGGTITPTPTAGGAVTDPFASLTLPTFASCTDSGVTLSSGTATLSAGTHCGSVSVSGGTLTLQHGTHIFESGMSMGVSGGSVVDDGNGGVTLFFDGADGMSTSGGSLNLHAPTTGTYKGMVILYARTNTDSLNLSGGTVSLTGAVYALDSTFYISGGTFTNVTFVVNAMDESGGGSATVNGAANTNYTSSSGATVSLIQ